MWHRPSARDEGERLGTAWTSGETALDSTDPQGAVMILDYGVDGSDGAVGRDGEIGVATCDLLGRDVDDIEVDGADELGTCDIGAYPYALAGGRQTVDEIGAEALAMAGSPLA